MNPIPLLAWLLDRTLGEPPNAVHPVAWMGRYLAAGYRRTPRGRPWLEALWGAALVLSGLALVTGLIAYLERRLRTWPQPWRALARAALLKATFSARGLDRAAEEVQTCLAQGRLEDARRALAWHLVSRPTHHLPASLLAAAAIESVAENASDSVVAPLLYYGLVGLPGAWAYRFVNTADAMLGYRDPARRHVGWFAARLDDALNLLPARLTALLLLVVGWWLGEDARQGWRGWRADARRTASPNAGHPMAATAGLLKVELTKVGHYCLNPGARPPTPADIGRARRLLRAVAALSAGLLTLLPGRNRRRSP